MLHPSFSQYPENCIKPGNPKKAPLQYKTETPPSTQFEMKPPTPIYIDEGYGAIEITEGEKYVPDTFAAQHMSLRAAETSYADYRNNTTAAPLPATDSADDDNGLTEDGSLPFEVFTQLEGDPCANDTSLLQAYYESATAIVLGWVEGIIAMMPLICQTEDTLRTIAEREERAGRSAINDQYFRYTIDKAISLEMYEAKKIPADDTDIPNILSRFDSFMHLVTLYDVKRRISQHDYEMADPGSARYVDLNKQRVNVVNKMLTVVQEVVATGEELGLRLESRLALIQRHDEIEHCRSFVAEGTLSHRDFSSARKELNILSQAAEATRFRIFHLRKAVSETLITWDRITMTVAAELQLSPHLVEEARMEGRKRHANKERQFEELLEQRVHKTQLTAKHHFLLKD